MYISTILPVKNGSNFIRFAIISVLRQTLNSQEVIVVDDHSTDDTIDIVRKEFPKLLILNSTGYGQAQAVNDGILSSRGKYITFIDHDDEWEVSKSKIQASILDDHQNVEVVVGGVANFSSERAKSMKRFGPSRVLGACMFRRDVFDRVGLFDTSLGHHSIIEWWSRDEARNLHLLEIQEAQYFRRIHERNSGKLFKDDARQDLLRVLKRNAKRHAESD